MRTVILLTILMFAGACAMTDDPRGGGLFSYWRHGEKSYQRRLDEREEAIHRTETQGDAARAQSGQLETDVAAKRAELKKQLAALSEMDEEVSAAEKECETLKLDSATKQKERDRLAQELKKLRSGIETVRMDPDLEIQQRQKEIAKLEAELKLLRERLSLLTTL